MKIMAPLAFAALIALASPPVAVAQTESESSRPALSLRFAGGTLADYVVAVQSAAGWANVVTDPRASEVRILPCELRNVTVLSALQAAGAMVRHADGEVQMIVEPIPGVAGGAPVFTIRLDIRKGRGAEAVGADPARHAVISIREIVSPRFGATGLEAEAVLTAIDTAVGLVTDGPKAVIKYHSDTGIVIVQGTGTQVRVVEEVVSQIRNDVRNQAAAAPKAGAAGATAASIEERIEAAERELAALKEEQKKKSGSVK